MEGRINLALVVPCYNEEDMLKPFEGRDGRITNLFLEEVNKQVFPETVQVYPVFVDDGSSDRTVEYIKSVAEADENIRYVSFSRNFGKEAALYAGMEKALSLSGEEKIDYIATMDVDLQDPPSLLPEMLESCLSGEYDSVATRRVTRKGEPPIRSFFARMFYKIINRISDVEIVDGARDYRMMPRKMVEAIVSMKEVNRFSKGLFSFVGFKTRYIEFENVQRAKGETKWSFWKLFMYSVEGIVSFSTVPLSIASYIGTLTCIGAFAYLLFIFIKTILYGDPVKGYPSMMCVILFLGGIQLIALGILGQYLARTYSEVKHRPIYIVREEK